jgi:hypothetical protein
VQYRRATERFKGGDFWAKIAPASLRAAQSEVKEQTNHLMNFIKNGDDYYQVIFEEGKITPFEDLEKAYSNHMRIHHKNDKAKIEGDHFPIKAVGFIVERQHLCKICKEAASKDTCGDHYAGGKNRRQKLIIKNMRIEIRIPTVHS